MGLFKKNNMKIAADPWTFDYVLNGFGYGKDAKLRAVVASNPNIQHQLMDKLAKDDVVEVRIAAARNPRKMTPKSWELLSSDESEEVRNALLEVWPEKVTEVIHGNGIVPASSRGRRNK